MTNDRPTEFNSSYCPAGTQDGQRRKSIGLPYAVLCAVLLVSSAAQAVTDAEVEGLLLGLSKNLASQLPQVQNKYSTLLTTFVGPGRKFTYVFIVDPSSGPWTQARTDNAQQIAFNTYCVGPTMAAFREFGVTAAWTGKDPQGRFLYSVAASPRDCR